MAGGETVGKVFDSADLNDLIKDVDKLGDSWKDTGDTMDREAFALIADQIDKMVPFIRNMVQHDARRLRQAAQGCKHYPGSKSFEKRRCRVGISMKGKCPEREKITINRRGWFAQHGRSRSEMFDEQSKRPLETLHRN